MKFVAFALDGDTIYEGAQELTMSRETGNRFAPYRPRLLVHLKPTALQPGVVGRDGWAHRLIILYNCLWVLIAAWQAKMLRSQKSSQIIIGD